MAKGGDSPRNADFVGRVVTDPNEPPQTRILSGWFGDAAEEGFRRLYSDAELSSYIDIPAGAILYSEELRDSQPAGGVLAWVQADAELKHGGSAASRAARFLDGQVQQDFVSGSLDKAGLRCATQAPQCAEVTGFTGQCTEQPQVGGAWPCITTAPHCVEVTGFTGQCTHQPWPNPTQYGGCTYLHCPTNDLTCVPYICNMVATGLPGCGPQPPDAGAKPAEGAEAPAAPPETSIPGCGYTKTWGLCDAGFAAEAVRREPVDRVTQAGPVCTTRLRPNCPPTPAGICTQSGPQCPTPNGPVCPTQQGPRCPTRMGPPCPTPGCPTRRPRCTMAVCPTETPRCKTDFGPRCPSIAEICTQFGPECPTVPALDCTVASACHTGGLQCTGNPCVQIDIGPTPATECFICPPQTQHHPNCPIGQEGFAGAEAPAGFGFGPIRPTPFPPCPTMGIACTRFPPQCPPRTFTPEQCPTLGIACTQLPEQCPRTVSPEACPTLGIACTQFAPQCPRTVSPEACPTLGIACTQFAPQCPRTVSPEACPTLGIACTQFAPQCPRTATPEQCPTLGIACTQFAPQCPRTATPEQCPTLGIACTQYAPQCPRTATPEQCPTLGIACTQFAPQCPRTATPEQCPTLGIACTQFAPQCPRTATPEQCPTLGIACTQFAQRCPSAVDACPSRMCGGEEAFAPAPAAAAGPIGPTGFHGCTLWQPNCPHPTIWTQIGPRCATPAAVCTQFAAQCPSAVDACPSRWCGGQQAGGMIDPNGGAARAAALWPTPATHCFVCDPLAQQQAGPTPATVCTQWHNCSA